MPMPRGRSGPRCRSIVCIPEAKEARTIPPGAGDREGDLGEAVIGLTVPGKAVSQHHHPLRLSIPLSDQDRTGSKLGPLLVKAGQTGGHGWSCFLRSRSIQHLQRCVIEIAEAISLEPIGDDRKQQMPRQMRRGRSLEDTLPARAQSPEIETAQMRDLVLKRRFGRGTTIATFLLHRIRPPVWPGPERQRRFCLPCSVKNALVRFLCDKGVPQRLSGETSKKNP